MSPNSPFRGDQLRLRETSSPGGRRHLGPSQWWRSGSGGFIRSSIKAKRHLNRATERLGGRSESYLLFVFISVHRVGLHTCNMGNSSSTPTALECMLRNFKKGFAGDCGVELVPSKLKRTCEIDWPSFGVGCPLEGTLDVPTARNVHRI